MHARMRWLGIVVVLGVVAPLRPAVAAEMENGIVAIVNDEAITQLDLEAVLFDQARESAPSSSAERLQLGLQQLIEERLILQAARQAKLTVEESVVDARLTEIRKRFPTDATFEEALQHEGLTRAMLRKRYRDQYLMQRAIEQEVRAKIVVTPSEMARYYQQHPEEMSSSPRVHARHLLVRVTPERPSAQALSTVEGLRRQLIKGETTFEAASRAFSEGPEANQGGDLGWVTPGNLRPELDQVLFTIQPGQVSEPILTELGYHLVFVEEREAVQTWTFEQVAPSIREKLLRQKFEEKLARWLTDLRAKAYINIREPQAVRVSKFQ